MTHVEEIEPRIAAALRSAAEDPRWAPPGWDDPVGRIRSAARRARRRRAAVAAAVSAVVVGAGGVGVAAWSHALSTARLTTPSDGGSGTGLDWLLTPQQWTAYTAAHPSPSPSRDLVASPAPVSSTLSRLESDVQAAVGATTLVRADAADGGEAGHAIVWLRTADGAPVAVERYRLDYPLQVGGWAEPTAPPGGDGGAPEAATGPDALATGSALTVLTGDRMGYGFDAHTQWSGPVVWVTTPDGWFTMWTAPVSADRLRSWAVTADARFMAGAGH